MAYQYEVNGRQVKLTLDPSTVAIRFHDEFPTSGRARATGAVAGMHPFEARFEVPDERLTLVPVAPPVVGGPAPAAALGQLDAQPEVAKALPVFRVGGNQVVPTERVILSVDAAKDAQPVLARHGLVELENHDGKIVAKAPDDADIFEVCESLSADPEVDYAEPDFVVISDRGGLDASVGGWDPMLQGQYALTITRALEAQALRSGDPAIRVAVLDDGVDTGHPDLAKAVVATFDALDRDSYQEPNWWDGHGTACAGLAVAIGGNGIGIRGVGCGCSLVAIRIARSMAPGSPWTGSTSGLAAGIRWAWREGKADVLSNSWSWSPSNLIEEEFALARSQGRGGRGCVIVVAAGNEDEPVGFPAGIPHLLTVAASNQFDEIKKSNSLDGEKWASSYGPAVGLAAPGVKNLTTDVREGGYGPGAYIPNFNGTSSATPIVAGACALLLSARPDLPEAQVRRLICDNTDPIGPFPYEGGRNDHAGTGRLNVLHALEAALALPVVGS